MPVHESCATCRFHLRVHPADPLGECHGGPPTALRHFSVRGLEMMAAWPVTPITVWCGRWEPERAPTPPTILTPPS